MNVKRQRNCPKNRIETASMYSETSPYIIPVLKEPSMYINMLQKTFMQPYKGGLLMILYLRTGKKNGKNF